MTRSIHDAEPTSSGGSFLTRASFWTGVGERSVKTFAQALLSMLTTGSVVWGFDWVQALGIAATAVVVSVLTSIADPTRTDTADSGSV
ncbi:holin [Trueperella pyogenes]